MERTIYTEDVFMDSFIFMDKGVESMYRYRVKTKLIPGYGGRYKVSSCGVVLSQAHGSWKRLKPFFHKRSRCMVGQVSLCKDGKIKPHYVHRLVRLVFGSDPLPSGAKFIPGYEGRYAVTDQGVVWSRSATSSKHHGEWKIVAPVKTHDGYLRIRFNTQDKKRKYVFLHRLVLEAFVGPCPEGMETRHFPDYNRTNCRLNNLSWNTKSQNAKDRVRKGSI